MKRGGGRNDHQKAIVLFQYSDDPGSRSHCGLCRLLCTALLWVTLQSGSGMHLEDGEDLTHIGRNIAGQIEGLMAGSPDSWTQQMGGWRL